MHPPGLSLLLAWLKAFMESALVKMEEEVALVMSATDINQAKALGKAAGTHYASI